MVCLSVCRVLSLILGENDMRNGKEIVYADTGKISLWD